MANTLIKRGAALGANSTIVCGSTVGEWAMVGSGSVVTRDVPAYGLVFGNPASLRTFVCACGQKLEKAGTENDMVQTVCPKCETKVNVSIRDWEMIK